MATLKQMLEIGGTLENAEKICRNLISQHGNSFLQDLELLLTAQGKPDEAYEINKQIIELDPTDDRAAFNHAWHLIRKGDLIEGYKQLNRGRKAGVYAKPSINTDKPIWRGEEGTILFHCECGLGDEIINVRFVKELVKTNKVIIGCSKSLMNIFNRIPGIQAVVNRDYSSQVYHDYWIPSMNAIDIIGIDYEHLSGKPYLTPDPEYVKKWSEIIQSDKLKIGIRWAGNICYEKELWRTLPPFELIDAVSNENNEIYSLQRDDGMVDLPEHVTDLSQELKTWDDTAGAMQNLDLIVSGCTSIPHMAGALGRPTWVIVPTLIYYTWARNETTTPWYDSVKIFKQTKFRDWSDPLKNVKEEIRCLN